MGNIDVLFDNYYNRCDGDSEQIESVKCALEQKVSELLGEEVYQTELEDLITSYASSTEKQGFFEGFKCAMSIWKECI